MNKNVCILLACLMAVAMAAVNLISSAYWMNFITLSYISTTFFGCWFGGVIAMFWTNDMGAWFYQCYDNFVSNAQFY